MKHETGRLVLADDHHLLRRGFRSLLSSEPGLEVVGEASNGLQAIEMCRRLEPDLILMDVHMPQMDGITATRRIRQDQPGVDVLIVTMQDDPDYLLEALDAGAAGYVLKDAPAGRLVSAVRRTLNGESPLNQELATLLLRRLADESQHNPEPSPSRNHESSTEALTPRETEVLSLLTTGQTNQQISEPLNIS
jgi:DNA-binding NarL/FixJ family response regulator